MLEWPHSRLKEVTLQYFVEFWKHSALEENEKADEYEPLQKEEQRRFHVLNH